MSNNMQPRPSLSPDYSQLLQQVGWLYNMFRPGNILLSNQANVADAVRNLTNNRVFYEATSEAANRGIPIHQSLLYGLTRLFGTDKLPIYQQMAIRQQLGGIAKGMAYAAPIIHMVAPGLLDASYGPQGSAMSFIDAAKASHQFDTPTPQSEAIGKQYSELHRRMYPTPDLRSVYGIQTNLGGQILQYGEQHGLIDRDASVDVKEKQLRSVFKLVAPARQMLADQGITEPDVASLFQIAEQMAPASKHQTLEERGDSIFRQYWEQRQGGPYAAALRRTGMNLDGTGFTQEDLAQRHQELLARHARSPVGNAIGAARRMLHDSQLEGKNTPLERWLNSNVQQGNVNPWTVQQDVMNLAARSGISGNYAFSALRQYSPQDPRGYDNSGYLQEGDLRGIMATHQNEVQARINAMAQNYGVNRMRSGGRGGRGAAAGDMLAATADVERLYGYRPGELKFLRSPEITGAMQKNWQESKNQANLMAQGMGWSPGGPMNRVLGHAISSGMPGSKETSDFMPYLDKAMGSVPLDVASSQFNPNSPAHPNNPANPTAPRAMTTAAPPARYDPFAKPDVTYKPPGIASTGAAPGGIPKVPEVPTPFKYASVKELFVKAAELPEISEGRKVLDMLRSAKAHSDKKEYRQKSRIIRKLMQDKPQDWLVDSQEGKYHGITHKPTGFKLHINPQDIPAGVARPGGGLSEEERVKLPYRDRVDVFGLDPAGKLLGGYYEDDKTHSVFGGGVEPGQTPLTAAQQEYLEEGGYKLNNPRVLPVDPVVVEWKPPYATPQQAERARRFRGSRTHFVAGDLGDQVPGVLEPSNLTNIRLRTLGTALKRTMPSKSMYPELAKRRRAALRHLLQERAAANA